MAEYKLFLNENVHTGQLREASSQLNWDTSNIVGHCLDEITDLTADASQNTETALRIRILKPDNLPPKKISRWKKDELTLFKLLRLTRKFATPEVVDDRIVTILDPLGIPRNTLDALVFFNTVSQRINYLLSDNCQRVISTMHLTGESILESRIIHQALYNRRYLVKYLNSPAA